MRVNDSARCARATRTRLLRLQPIDWLPAVEAVPAELVRRTDLIGEPIGVDPSFLLGPPATIPGELEHSRLATTLDDYRPDEVGAAGARVNVEPFDGPLRVRVKDLVDEPNHLDARDRVRVGDGWRLMARRQRDDVSLEAFAGGRAREELGIDRHGRNISRGRADAEATVRSLKTKLTTGSAQPYHA